MEKVFGKVDRVNMLGNQFHRQLQEGIYRWLKSEKKCGFLELDSGIAALGSVLGKRSENQDRAILLRVKFDKSQKPSIAALVLCDGMGGMVSGGDCADLAISTFAATLVQSNANLLIEKLERSVRDANEAVYETFQGEGGATLSAIACDEDNEWAAINLGDSRIYSVLNSGSVEQLTVDDTLEKQLEDLNLAFPPPEFRQLLQYVGMGEGIKPRCVELSHLSEIKWLLITSDGAHNIPSDIFQTLISNAEYPKDAVFRLTQLSEWLGGKDNSTVAILSIENNLFSKTEDSHLSHCEVWSIPGKADFFSIKPLQAEPSFHKSSTALDTKVSESEKTVKQEEASKQKYLPKKKNQSNAKKTDLKSSDGNKNKANGKGKLDKATPELNIEFLEEN